MERKYKISMLAASVLMGISLTSVTAMAAESANTATEKPKTSVNLYGDVAGTFSTSFGGNLTGNFTKVTDTANGTPAKDVLGNLTALKKASQTEGALTSYDKAQDLAKQIAIATPEVAAAKGTVDLRGTQVTNSVKAIFGDSATSSLSVIKVTAADDLPKDMNTVVNTLGIAAPFSLDESVKDGAATKIYGNYTTALTDYFTAVKNLTTNATAAAADAVTDGLLTGDLKTKYDNAQKNYNTVGKIFVYQLGVEQALDVAKSASALHQPIVTDFLAAVANNIPAGTKSDAAPADTNTLANQQQGLAYALAQYNDAKSKVTSDHDIANLVTASTKFKALITAANSVKKDGASVITTADVNAVNTIYDAAINTAKKEYDNLYNSTDGLISKNADYATSTDTGFKNLLTKLQTAGDPSADVDETNKLLSVYITDMVKAGLTDTGDTGKTSSLANLKTALGAPAKDNTAATGIYLKLDAYKKAQKALGDAVDKLTKQTNAYDTAYQALSTKVATLSGLNTELATTTTGASSLSGAQTNYAAALSASAGAASDLLKNAFGTDSNGTSAAGSVLATSLGTYASADKTTPANITSAVKALVGDAKGLAYGGSITPAEGAATAITLSPVVELAKINLQNVLNTDSNNLAKLKGSYDSLKLNADDASTAYDSAVATYNAALAAKNADPDNVALQIALQNAKDDVLLAGAHAAAGAASVSAGGLTVANIAVPTALTDTTVFDTTNGTIKTGYESAAALNGGNGENKLLAVTKVTDSLATPISNIGNARKLTGQAAQLLSDLLPFSNADQQKTAVNGYNTLMAIKSPLVNADVTFTKPLPTAETLDLTKLTPQDFAKSDVVNHTLYLGGLSQSDLGGLDANGDWASLSANTDANSVVTSNSYSDQNIYKTDKDHRFKTTMLNVEAPLIGQTGDNLLQPNTVDVGGSAGNTLSVYTSTYDYSKTNPYSPAAAKFTAQSGSAVTLAGNLRTGYINGIGLDGQQVRGADQINLHNMTIDNTLAQSDLAKGSNIGNITGLLISTSTVDQKINVNDTAAASATDGLLTTSPVAAAPGAANIVLKDVNINAVNNTASELTRGYDGYEYSAKNGNATAIDISGKGNHISITNGNISAHVAGEDLALGDKHNLGNATALAFGSATGNNVVDITGATITGDITDAHTAPAANTKVAAADVNTVNLVNSTVDGDIRSENTPTGVNYLNVNMTGSTLTGKTGHSPDLTMNGGSTFNLTGNSSLNTLTLAGSNTLNLIDSNIGDGRLGLHGVIGENKAYTLTVEQTLNATIAGSKDPVTTVVHAGTYSPNAANRLFGFGQPGDYRFGTLYVNGAASSFTNPALFNFDLQNGGTEPITVAGKLAESADPDDSFGQYIPHAFMSYLKGTVTGVDGTAIADANPVDISHSPVAELGVYQYQAVQQADPLVKNRENVYFQSNGKLSNSAATVAALAAAPANIASLEADALAKHMTSLRHSQSSGVWLSYYGGSNKDTLKNMPEYNLKTNGVMLGIDTQMANQWLAGVAFTSAKSDLSVMNSTGDVNSYGAQFYLSRRYDNGMFVDGDAQFSHFSNKAKARMLDGGLGNGDYATNGYGLGVKLGYAYQNQGFYAEPYLRAIGRAFSGSAYNLSNGMVVSNSDYKSFTGEIGADLGYTVQMGNNGYMKPYLHLAVLDEFANGNSIRVNNASLDNSINGAAFQVGIGAEISLMKNLGGYVSYDYTTGGSIKRPWQATVGINYTW